MSFEPSRFSHPIDAREMIDAETGDRVLLVRDNRPGSLPARFNGGTFPNSRRQSWTGDGRNLQVRERLHYVIITALSKLS